MNAIGDNSADDQVDQLVQLTKLPSVPAPFSTDGNGEYWSWDKYFMTYQKNPKTMLETIYAMQGKSAPTIPIKYHYALSVYYHLNHNPYGPSQRPLLIYTIEQGDISTLVELVGGDKSSPGDPLQNPGGLTTMLCKFERSTHYNLGDYDGEISDGEVRKKFFAMMRDDLRPNDSPVHHGNLADAWGHENSGLPAKSKKGGCLTEVIAGIGALFMIGLMFM